MKIELKEERDYAYTNKFYAVFVDDVKVTMWTIDIEEAEEAYNRIVASKNKNPEQKVLKTTEV